MRMTVELSSSLREIPPALAFARAEGVAESLGITRVTEITRLDRIGVPVFVAVRPSAVPGSLCVNAGKGLTRDEARVGAIMEAIEYAWAEPGRASLPITRGRLRDVLDGRPMGCLDLCPALGQTLDLDAPIDCTVATDMITKTSTQVPAELVFHPLRSQRRQYYGTSTNGLASGSSVEEATLHALAELIERDVLSFHRVVPNPRLVALSSLPAPLVAIIERLRELGFDLHVRALDNPFGLPCFAALVADPGQWRMTMRGEGCHPIAAIAAVRAVTETIQARLSLIHGGRDDLVNVWGRHEGRSEDDIERIYRAAVAAFATGPEIEFAAVADHRPDAIPAAIDLLVERLEAAGLPRVLRAVYTPADYPVQVVRVIVPGLEHYTLESRRAGPRIRAFARQHGRSL